jgi:hypothetical protein
LGICASSAALVGLKMIWKGRMRRVERCHVKIIADLSRLRNIGDACAAPCHRADDGDSGKPL